MVKFDKLRFFTMFYVLCSMCKNDSKPLTVDSKVNSSNELTRNDSVACCEPRARLLPSALRAPKMAILDAVDLSTFLLLTPLSRLWLNFKAIGYGVVGRRPENGHPERLAQEWHLMWGDDAWGSRCQRDAVVLAIVQNVSREELQIIVCQPAWEEKNNIWSYIV